MPMPWGPKKKQSLAECGEENLSNKYDILQDHVRHGRIFKPPLRQLGRVEETKWYETTMPELLWIGMVLDHYPLTTGIDISCQLVQEAENVEEHNDGLHFASISSYDALSEDAKASLTRTLSDKGILELLKNALMQMPLLYPECPINFFYQDNSKSAGLDGYADIDYMKGLVERLFPKRDRLPVLVQAQAVYTLAAVGRLKIAQGVSLGNLNALASYPNTDESRKVAASVCATCNMIIPMSLETHDAGWSRYFWKRNFEITDCEYEEPK